MKEDMSLADLVAMLEHHSKNVFEDDLDDPMNPSDFFGGNMDDAYYGGLEHGQADMAETVLHVLRSNGIA